MLNQETPKMKKNYQTDEFSSIFLKLHTIKNDNKTNKGENDVI